MITLGELCDLVAGRVTLVIEIKSHYDGDTRLAARTVEVLQAYAGPVAAMSFDPLLVSALRTFAPGLPRGLVAESSTRGQRPGQRLWSYLGEAARSRKCVGGNQQRVERAWPGPGLQLSTVPRGQPRVAVGHGS